MLDSDGCRRLIAATLLRAVNDVRRGKPCNGGCAHRGHVCAEDARIFLDGDLARDWLDLFLDIDVDAVRHWVGKV